MHIFSKSLFTIAFTACLLAACVSDDESEPATVSSNATNFNTTGSNASSNGSFFNANDGLDFANKLGGSLTKMFNVANDAGSNSIEGYREESLFTARAAQRDTTACDRGSVETVVSTDDDTNVPTSFALTFNNCRSEGSVANGSISVSLSGNEQDLQLSMIFDNFSTTEGSETSSVDGSININGSGSGGVSNFVVSGPVLTMVADGETLQFSDYSLTGSENNAAQTSSLGASARIQSSTDGDLTLSIDPPFVSQGSASEYPSSGRLRMTHSDGSQLEIQADNGNPNSFDFVINDNGTVTSGTDLWDNTDLIF